MVGSQVNNSGVSVLSEGDMERARLYSRRLELLKRLLLDEEEGSVIDVAADDNCCCLDGDERSFSEGEPMTSPPPLSLSNCVGCSGTS
mmetsp:Transcript_14578/g.24781  ORF Transcript_14578/g.24781 Transcript_14578/m.24781 type:complete len:88 (+) Transcript_14578:472-735(+)